MLLRILLSVTITVLASSALKDMRISDNIELAEDGQLLNATTKKPITDPISYNAIELTDNREIEDKNTFYILNDVLLKKDSQDVIQVIKDADYKEVECLDENIYTCCQALFIKEDSILKALKDVNGLELLELYPNVYIYQVEEINLLIHITDRRYIKAVSDIRMIEGSDKNELYLYKGIVLLESVYGFMQVASDPLDMAIGFDSQ